MLPALISQIVVAVKDTSLAAIARVLPRAAELQAGLSGSLDNPLQMLTVRR